jgi:hypothetical protein
MSKKLALFQTLVKVRQCSSLLLAKVFLTGKCFFQVLNIIDVEKVLKSWKLGMI